jgi:hypothetical protein
LNREQPTGNEKKYKKLIKAWRSSKSFNLLNQQKEIVIFPLEREIKKSLPSPIDQLDPQGPSWTQSPTRNASLSEFYRVYYPEGNLLKSCKKSVLGAI